jgi:hypothetical protein
VLLPASFVFFRYAKKKKIGPCDEGELSKVFLYVGCFVCAFTSLILSGFIIDCFANPTFAAIKQLKKLL